MPKKLTGDKKCSIGAKCKGACIAKDKDCLIGNSPAVSVAASKIIADAKGELKPWPKEIKSVAFGRFEVVHSGHEKLFDKADLVLLSKATPAHVEQLSRLYPTKKFTTIEKGLFNYLATFKSPAPNVVLGEDNKSLGDQLLKYKVADKITIIPRESVGSTASSSRARELFRKGSSPADLVKERLFSNLDRATYAQKLALNLE